MHRRRSLRMLLLLPLAVGPSACSSTRLKASWRDPSIGTIRFQKVVAFVVAKDQVLRRRGEQEVCAQIPRTTCVPAFGVVPDEELPDTAKVKSRVAAAGFDGAVVLRPLARRIQQTYVPGAPRPMWGYYGAAWPVAYDPGYVRQDELVDVETAIYSVKDQKLLWAGTTESTNPNDIEKTVREIGDAVGAQLRKEGLVPNE